MIQNYPTQSAEIGIIAGLIGGNDLWEIVDRYEITTEAFVSDAHREIFRELANRHEERKPFDYLTISSALGCDTLGVQEALASALDAEPTAKIPTLFEQYCEAIYQYRTTLHNRTVAERVRKAAEQGQDPREVAADFRSPAATGRKKSRLSVRKFSELLSMEFDDLDNFFGDRIIAAGQPVTILGPGGVGKSRIVTQLAMCMIVGRDFLGMPTRGEGKRWLFIQSENSTRRLKKDIASMMAGLVFQVEDQVKINKNLFFHTIEKEEDTFLDLENEADFREISALIEDIKPDIVVFDPLNTFTSLELNADKDMKQVVQSISRVVKKGNPERIPLVIHHSLTGKAGAAKAVGWDKASYGRNSKVLQAWTRAQINISPVDPENPNRLVMACGKNNNGAMFPDVGILFQERGIYVTDPDFDPDAFRQNVGLEKKAPSNKKIISPDEVAGLFENQIRRSELLDRIKNLTGCSKSVAYDALSNAERARKITRGRLDKVNPLYSKPDEN